MLLIGWYEEAQRRRRGTPVGCLGASLLRLYFDSVSCTVGLHRVDEATNRDRDESTLRKRLRNFECKSRVLGVAMKARAVDVAAQNLNRGSGAYLESICAGMCVAKILIATIKFVEDESKQVAGRKIMTKVDLCAELIRLCRNVGCD